MRLKKRSITAARKLRNDRESSGEADRYEKLQPKECPTIDGSFIGAKIEQLWTFTEQDGTMVQRWCQEVVIAIKTNNRVHVEWNNNCVRKGEPEVTEEKFLKSKWNKHVERSWRMNPEFLC